MNSVDKFAFASLGGWDWRASLVKVDAPTLIIHGVKDPLTSEARKWADALPNSELLLLEGVGHFPYIEVPERIFKAVDESLREDPGVKRVPK